MMTISILQTCYDLAHAHQAWYHYQAGVLLGITEAPHSPVLGLCSTLLRTPSLLW